MWGAIKRASLLHGSSPDLRRAVASVLQAARRIICAAAKALIRATKAVIPHQLPAQTHLELPRPPSDVKIFVCGPPGMYESLSGARSETTLSGALAELGYSAAQVVKF